VSAAAVRFGPVQRPIFPNPGLDLRVRFGKVRFKFRGGSDGFEPISVSHDPNHLKKCLQRSFTTKETTHPPIYPSIRPSQGTLASFGIVLAMIFRSFVPVSISQISFQHSSVAPELRLGPNIFLWKKRIMKCTNTIKKAHYAWCKMELAITALLKRLPLVARSNLKIKW
jgi:hypothetical protein